MPGIHRVCKYCNLSYFEAIDLDFEVFRLMDVNAVVEFYESQGEEGREYLNTCKRLTATEPDYKAIDAYQKAHLST